MGEANCSRAMRLRTILLIVSMGLAMSIAGCLPVLAATRQIVLLYDERVELPGLSLLDAEIVRVLRSNSTEPVEIYREAMDLSRFASSSYKTLLRDFLRAKYADRKIDVVVAVMAPALDFLLAYGDLIFPGAPIVFCGVDRRQLGTRSLPPNVYGVLIKREFAPTLELALRLHPATNNVVVVSGTSEFDTMLLARGAKGVPFVRESNLLYLSFETLSAAAARDAFAIAVPGRRFNSHDVQRRRWPTPHPARSRRTCFQRVQRAGVRLSRPISRSWNRGGSLYSFTAHGDETARMVLRTPGGRAARPARFRDL